MLKATMHLSLLVRLHASALSRISYDTAYNMEPSGMFGSRETFAVSDFRQGDYPAMIVYLRLMPSFPSSIYLEPSCKESNQRHKQEPQRDFPTTNFKN